MSKLIYAKSKTAFETAYTAADRLSTGAIYRSIAFLEDGYLWTHGQYFRFFDASNPFTVTYAAGTSVNTGNIVTLKDSSGVALTTFDVGVTAITGDAVITPAAINQGTVALTHALRAAGADVDITNTVGTNKSAINIPTLTINKYGHVTALSSVATAVDQVKATLASGNYYLLGHTTNTADTAEAVKLASVYVNAGNLTATKFIGSLNYSLSLTLNGGASTFNNTAATSVSFYAPTSSGTTGQIMKSNGAGAAPTWYDIATSVTSLSSGSTDTQIPTAKAVYNAVIAGISTGDAMVYKGVLNATSSGLPAADKGDTYKVNVAGTFNGTQKLEVGDMLICNTDATAAVAYGSIVAGSWANWDIVQTNLTDAVVASSALIANALVLGDTAASVKSLAFGSAGTVLKSTGTAVEWGTDNDTLNTVGATNLIATKLFLVGAQSQTANPQSYTNINVYIGTDNKLYSNGVAVLTDISAYVQNNLTYSTSNTTYALSAYQGYVLNNNAITAASISASTLTLTRASGNITASIPIFNQDTTGTAAKATNIVGGTAGQVPYQSAANTTTFVTAATAAGQVLKWDGTKPTWGTDNDTHWTSNLITGATAGATVNGVATNGNVFLNLVENGTVRNSHNIVGTGATTVISDAAGKITIDSLNTWRNVSAYKLSAATILATIGGLDLQFGSEFLWDSTANELKLGWAEVDTAGAITYAL